MESKAPKTIKLSSYQAAPSARPIHHCAHTVYRHHHRACGYHARVSYEFISFFDDEFSLRQPGRNERPGGNRRCPVAARPEQRFCVYRLYNPGRERYSERERNAEHPRDERNNHRFKLYNIFRILGSENHSGDRHERFDDGADQRYFNPAAVGAVEVSATTLGSSSRWVLILFGVL